MELYSHLEILHGLMYSFSAEHMGKLLSALASAALLKYKAHERKKVIFREPYNFSVYHFTKFFHKISKIFQEFDKIFFSIFTFNKYINCHIYNFLKHQNRDFNKIIIIVSTGHKEIAEGMLVAH